MVSLKLGELNVVIDGDRTPLKRELGEAERDVARHRDKLAVLGAAAGVALGVGLAGGAAGAVAQVIALSGSLLQLIGVLGAVPALGFAAAAGIISAFLAFRHFKDALSDTGRAAGGSAAATVAAHRRIEAAVRAVSDAQKALNAARVDAKKRLDDYALSLARASLDEEGATRAVAEARKALDEAQASGNADDIAEADFRFREANQTLAEVRKRHKELAAEAADANRRQVEGSDQVQAALRRQADAQRELADARSAKSGGGGGVDKQAEAMAKLAPSARDLVTTIRSLMPAWAGVGRAVQQTSWVGVARELRATSSEVLPGVQRGLVGVAAGWNLAVRESLAWARTNDTVRDGNKIFANTAAFSDRIGRSIRPIINGLLQWAAVGSSFLPRFGRNLQGIAEGFERWSKEARDSGRASAWIDNALHVLTQVWHIARDVGASIAAIFKAGDDGGDFLAGLERGAAAMRAWLESAEGQEKVAGVLATLRNIVEQIVNLIPKLMPLADTLAAAAAEGGAIEDTFTVTGKVMGFLADHADELAKALPFLAAGFILLKTTQVAANAAAVLALPLETARIASNFAMAAALRANTAALASNAVAARATTAATVAGTAAENVGILARGRAVVGMVAQRVAMLAVRAATIAWTAVQWLLNVALTANPIGLVIAAIALLIVGIIYAWKHSETFRKIVTAAWEGIQAAAKAVVDWFVKTAWPFLKAVFQKIASDVSTVYHAVVSWFGKVISFVTSLPGKIANAAKGLWNGIVNTFKAAINAVIDLWNKLDLSIDIKVPSWVPGVGGKGFSIPDIFPDLPRLAQGGVVPATAGGRAVRVAEAGKAEAIAPLDKLAAMIRDGMIAAMSQSEGRLVAEVPVDLGEGVTQVLEVKLRRRNRATRRKVTSRAGARR